VTELPLFDLAQVNDTMTGAVISPCGTYRYQLVRRWGQSASAVFIMLNPSTADAVQDDPTIRRCVGFAKREACGGIIVVNLFGLRSPDPAALIRHADPVGPANDTHILASVGSGASVVIAAWGAHSFAAERAHKVHALLTAQRVKLLCLGLTQEGYPRHPLYVRRDAPLIPLALPPAGVSA
jgi:hypothetical protein